MARRKSTPKAPRKDAVREAAKSVSDREHHPDVVHLEPKDGTTIALGSKVYATTVQVERHRLPEVVGDYVEVSPGREDL